jgi:hypothetical protein
LRWNEKQNRKETCLLSNSNSSRIWAFLVRVGNSNSVPPMPDGKGGAPAGRNKIRVGPPGENPAAGPVQKRVRSRQKSELKLKRNDNRKEMKMN